MELELSTDCSTEATVLDAKAELPQCGELKRDITWKDGFWLASGTPLVAYLILGAVAGLTGKVSWLVVIASVFIGFSQCLTYAEIAQLFPNKSGGASVYGAMAWIRYNQLVAPLSTWCNWFAVSPSLAVIAGMAGTYMVWLFPAGSWVRTWQITLVNLDWLMDGLSLRISMTWVFAILSMLAIFAIQHSGVAKSARIQKYFAASAMVVVFGIFISGLVKGRVATENLLPLLPPTGAWDAKGWTLILAALFLCGSATYAFESSICYVSEFKDPKKDIFKVVVSSGLICLVAYTLQPIVFQGYLGSKATDPQIMNGTGIAAALAGMVGGSDSIYYLVYVCFLFVVVVGLMSAMAGSSRTIYQASKDGWFPRYLSRVNKNGAPTAAMWTDLGFNLILLLCSNYFFILMASNVCYMIFIFMNLQSGWLHRIDAGHIDRPYKAPAWLIGFNAFLGHANIAFIGFAAHILGKGPILSGFFWAAVIIPVFLYRHYVTDKGVFPEHMYDDLGIKPGEMPETKGGYLPNLALAGGALVFIVSYFIAGTV
jgi:amino acid transporter